MKGRKEKVIYPGLEIHKRNIKAAQMFSTRGTVHIGMGAVLPC